MKKAFLGKITILLITGVLFCFPESAFCSERRFATGYSEELDVAKEGDSLSFAIEEPLKNGLRGGELPAVYDPRNGECGYTLPAIRDQNPYGTCWAFATLACMEIDLIKNHGVTSDIDLSELELAYISYYHPGIDPVGGLADDDYYYSFMERKKNFLEDGGTGRITSNILLARAGISDEKRDPILVYNNDNCNLVLSSLNNGDADNNHRYFDEFTYTKNDAILKGYKSLPDINKNDTNIKNYIMKYGAVAVSYITDAYSYTTEYYNSDTGAFYYNGKYPIKDGPVHHMVTIVGWDDNYAVDNFSTAKPSYPGAWIVRNSWGDKYGVPTGETVPTENGSRSVRDGYFYLSYYSLSVSDPMIFDADLVNDDERLYQYDSAQSYFTIPMNKKTANVFNINEAAGTQKIEKVILEGKFKAGTKVKIDIYSNLPYENKPDIGKKTATLSKVIDENYSGTLEFETEDIFALAGESFSIIAYSDSNNYIYYDSSYYQSAAIEKKHENESRIFEDNAWNSINNLCIKVITKNCDTRVIKSTTKIYCSINDVKLYAGESLSIDAKAYPEDADYSSIIWSSSNEKVAVVNENGKLTAIGKGTATITGRIFRNESVSVSINVSVEAANRPRSFNITSVKNKDGYIQIAFSKAYMADGYRVYRKKGNGSYKLIGTVDKNKLSFKDKNVTNGTDYSYYVEAYNEEETRKADRAVNVLNSSRYISPVKITGLTNKKSRKAVIDFTSNRKASGYEILYSTNKSFLEKKTKTVVIKKGTTHKKTISKLSKGKTCYFKIRAYKDTKSGRFYSAFSSIKKLKISR